jgi:hypothetical protein
MPVAPTTLQRREYKYLIDERTVERLRRYIRGICAIDPCAEVTGGRYVTDTLYFDTPALMSYWATVNDAGDRFKLRVRTYPSTGSGPVYFEVKRRVGDSIRKTRGSFAGDWARLLDVSDPEILATVALENRAAIDNFMCHYRYAPMRPCVLVRYEREPYVSLVDDYARVTLDRNLSCQRAYELSVRPEHEGWCHVDDPVSQRGLSVTESSVLLELKFTNIVPRWMRQMIHALDMQRLAFCKYTRSIDSMHRYPRQRTTRTGR